MKIGRPTALKNTKNKWGLTLGQKIKLGFPLKPGEAEFVDLLPAGKMCLVADILKYYGDDPPARAFNVITRDRYVFKRVDTGSYVVVPDSQTGRNTVAL